MAMDLYSIQAFSSKFFVHVITYLGRSDLNRNRSWVINVTY